MDEWAALYSLKAEHREQEADLARSLGLHSSAAMSDEEAASCRRMVAHHIKAAEEAKGRG